jgi:acid stress chaperone HdeB
MRNLLVGAAFFWLASVPAAAEDKMVVDMSAMTCRELTKLGFQDFAGSASSIVIHVVQPVLIAVQ